MRPSSNSETIVCAWELCQHASRWRLPPALLSALSGRPLEETLALGVAKRDAYLVAWRVALFGPQWIAFANCPKCNAMLEYELPIAAGALAEPEDEFEVDVGGHIWKLRSPNTLDLIEAAGAGNREEARRVLMRKCVSGDAPVEAMSAISSALAARHVACSTVNLVCGECASTWEAAFHAGEFLWREVRAAAKRLLREVDAIARVYGWSESEILSLSQARRDSYLELVQ